MYGLAIAGEDGVSEVLRNLLADFDLTLGLSGYTRVSELRPDALEAASGPLSVTRPGTGR